MTDAHDLAPINRRQASSGRVDFGNTVVLRETSRSRISFIPFFVPRSVGTELAVKIESYRKGASPTSWVLNDRKSVSLDDPAARALLRALRQHFALSEQSTGDGEYLVLRLSDGTMSDLSEHDPATIVDALTNLLRSPGIVEHLAGTNLSEELAGALRGAIRLSEMRNAVAGLRQLLDGGVTAESSYQDWCETHSWAFGNAYVMRDSVRTISIGDTLDLLLPSVISGYRDIVELKRPDMTVLQYDKAHRNYYFSQDTSRAIGQCHRYLDVLHEVAAKGLMDHPEIVAYHPRAIVVIGRSATWNEDVLRALHGLNRRISDITVMTYDQLLAQGERLLDIFTAGIEEAAPDLNYDIDPDDLPF